MALLVFFYITAAKTFSGIEIPSLYFSASILLPSNLYLILWTHFPRTTGRAINVLVHKLLIMATEGTQQQDGQAYLHSVKAQLAHDKDATPLTTTAPSISQMDDPAMVLEVS